ncbi:MAG: STAS domain-containing protein [Planctomycetota bacterium]
MTTRERAVPILRVRGVVVVPIQVDLTDSLVERLEEDILLDIERRAARGLIVDVSAIELLDTYTAKALTRIARAAGLMGTPTIVCGLRPAVAQTLSEMGFRASGFTTALNLDDALDRSERW